MADSIVETIIVKLGLDVSSYNPDADKAVKKTTDLTNKMGKADDVASNLGKKLAKVFATSAILVGIGKMVDQVAKLNDQLFFLEKNLGMSSQTIQAWQNAAGAMGGSADGMTSSMKSLNMAMNDFVIMGDTSLMPYMNALGVSMVDVNGKVRDTDKVMLDLADSFSRMDREQAFSLASKMGIDEGTFNTLVQGRQEMEKMIEYQKTMYKSSEAELQVSRNLQRNRALLGQHWESMKTMMANALMPLFLKSSEVLLGLFEYLQKNQKSVQAVFKGIAFILTAVLIPSLVKATVAALAFIAPFAPFILVVGALGAAFIALYDDYKTWAEGGQSLFDWGAFRKYIDDSTLSTDNLKNAFKNLVTDMKNSTIPTLKGYADIVKLLSEGKFKAAGSLAADMLVGFGERVGNVIDDVTGNKQGTLIETGRNMLTDIIEKGAYGYSQGGATSTNGSNIAKLLSTQGTTRNYLLISGETETRTGGTVAWRNNNPGNLKFEFAGSADKTVKSKRSRDKALSDAKKRYQGVIDLDQWGNAIFESMEAGAVAKAQLLKKQHGNKTMPEMLRGYAISDYSGTTNYASYEATINKEAKARGVNLAGKKIGQMSDAEFEALAAGMVKAEGVKTGNITRSGAIMATQSMQQGTTSAPRVSNSSTNKNTNVDVKIDNINVKTSADTLKDTSTIGIQSAVNQLFMTIPASQ